MAGAGARKISALVAALAIFAMLELHTAEAQGSSVNECRVGLYRCDRNAYCRDTFTAYRCICRNGWSGDGYVGIGRSGCRRRRLRRWQVVMSIVGAIFGALLVAGLCCACVRNCLRRRSRSAIAQQNAADHPSPPINVAADHQTTVHKVPGPAGVV